MKNVTDLFKQLTTIDSPSGEEQEMASCLKSWLDGLGLAYKQDAAGNICAKNSTPGTPLLLSAHMDTVEPGRGIKPIVKDGIIKSGGTTILGADNKAALAAIMTAVEEAKNTRALELLFTVREETGGGVDRFPFKWLTAKKGLIFDSSNPLGGIVLGSPFIVNFTATVTGKAAHASRPESGVNAFTPVFHTLSSLETGLLDEGKTTINVGLISGGTGVNTIPGLITVKGEIRSYDKKLFDGHLASIKSLFGLAVGETKAKLTFSTDGYCPGYVHEKKAPFVKAIAGIVTEAGLPLAYHPVSGVSDANILNAHGVETVNLADGTRYSHTVNEEIAVADLEKLAVLIRECISKL